MTDKVKITQEQADAIEREVGGGGDRETPVEIHVNGWKHHENQCLNNLSLEEFVRALYIGYEVEPEFRDDEWVFLVDGTITRILYVRDDEIMPYPSGIKFSHGKGGDCWYAYSDIKRHATPEEIAKEKTRRWWEKHGREPWELKPGDVLRKICSSFDFEALEVESVDAEYITLADCRQINYKTTNMKINYKVICFAEDRKDVDHG